MLGFVARTADVCIGVVRVVINTVATVSVGVTGSVIVSGGVVDPVVAVIVVHVVGIVTVVIVLIVVRAIIVLVMVGGVVLGLLGARATCVVRVLGLVARPFHILRCNRSGRARLCDQSGSRDDRRRYADADQEFLKGSHVVLISLV
jgi:hypothetical protein